MILETAYDIGDQVWNVWDRQRREVEKCSVCRGAGKMRVVGSDDLISCPKCWGKGESETGEVYVEYVIAERPLTIGQVRVMAEGPTDGSREPWSVHTDRVDESNMGPRSHKREETYMCIETGVGSGRIYKREDLFPSIEEAEAAARARTAASVDRIPRYSEVQT